MENGSFRKGNFSKTKLNEFKKEKRDIRIPLLGGEGNSLRGDGLDKSLNEHARRKPLPCESLPCPLLVMAVLAVSLSFEPALRPNTHNTEAPWPQAQTHRQKNHAN